MDKSQRHNIDWMKPDIQKTMCDSIYMKFENRQNSSMVLDVSLKLFLVGNFLTGRLCEGAYLTAENMGIHIWENSSSSTCKMCVFHSLYDIPQIRWKK